LEACYKCNFLDPHQWGFFFNGKILPYFDPKIGILFIFAFLGVNLTNFAKFLLKICQNFDTKKIEENQRTALTNLRY
jgi:hypothetical protein